MAPAQLVVFIEKQAGECMTPSPSEERNWSQKGHAPYCVCTSGERSKHFIEDMNFETRQRFGTRPPSEQNKTRLTCQVSTMGSTCLHWSLPSFLYRLLTPLEYYFRVISTRTGMVAAWSLGENHPTLWLEWVLFPCWCLDIVKIDKTPLSYFNLGGLGALFWGT